MTDTQVVDVLTLPRVEQKNAKIRRVLSDPAVAAKRAETLNPEQKVLFDMLIDRASLGEGEHPVIKGYAGTGKSYLIATFVESMLLNHKMKIAMTAPTNKAVRVLKDQADFNHENLEFSTIHSLLGLREQIDGFGNQKFVQMSKEHCRLGEYSILIIDESSMLSDELFLLIYPYIESGKLLAIFMGDPCQIPPVGMKDSIPFDTDKQSKYKLKEYSLTTIVRQAVGNPIIECTMKLRTALGRPVSFPVKENKQLENSADGLYWFDGTKKTEVVNLLKTYFQSQNFKMDSDFVKVVCWTNRSVDGFNRMIRKMIYGPEVKALEVGEKLIANKPIVDTNGEGEKTIIMSTNDEFEVLSFSVKHGNYKGTKLAYYEVSVLQEQFGYSAEKIIRIIHESSQDDYNAIIEHLKELAVAQKRGSYEAASKWKDYYEFHEVFANVNYNYAITAHKSQGSTYQNCFVVETDIDANKDIIERNRIKYTAMSRASKKLFVIC